MRVWWNEWEEPGPLDSFDAFQMGLRPPRCNGCEYARLRWELGDRFLSRNEAGWVAVYELDAESVPGQGEPREHDGRPIRHRGSFMSVGHSDECYRWSPPSERPGPREREQPVVRPRAERRGGWLSSIERVKHSLARALRSKDFGFLRRIRWLLKTRRHPVTTWHTLDGRAIPITEMTPRHLINSYRMLCRRSAIRFSLVLWGEIRCRGYRLDGDRWLDAGGREISLDGSCTAPGPRRTWRGARTWTEGGKSNGK